VPRLRSHKDETTSNLRVEGMSERSGTANS
jgi:hypothetical protein